MTDRERKSRLDEVRYRIAEAATKSGRGSGSVRLVAVSKTRPWGDVAAFAKLGVRDFGENYVQEALAKKQALECLDLRWHFIGTLQSNKAKFLPGNFHLFHGLDSLSLAKKIDSQAERSGADVDCLLEVNVDEEISKGGVPAGAVLGVLEEFSKLSHLKVKGLMCIPAPVKGSTRPAFARLRGLWEQANLSGAVREPLTELSMGMSADFEEAILEGATIVRVGTKLFGERT